MSRSARPRPHDSAARSAGRRSLPPPRRCTNGGAPAAAGPPEAQRSRSPTPRARTAGLGSPVEQLGRITGLEVVHLEEVRHRERRTSRSSSSSRRACSSISPLRWPTAASVSRPSWLSSARADRVVIPAHRRARPTTPPLARPADGVPLANIALRVRGVQTSQPVTLPFAGDVVARTPFCALPGDPELRERMVTEVPLIDRDRRRSRTL